MMKTTDSRVYNAQLCVEGDAGRSARGSKAEKERIYTFLTKVKFFSTSNYYWRTHSAIVAI